MRLLYDIFFIIFSIFYLPCLLLKGKLHKDFGQRFGRLPGELTRLERPVWIHAVSVGEALVAVKLASRMKKDFPQVPVVVSTTTKTGNEMVKRSDKGDVDACFYYPVDIRPVVSKVVKMIDPRLYVMVETELWPNLLEELNSRKVPVILANGRISDNSFRNYKKIKFITRRILRCIDRFCMQSDKDAERIIELGADSAKVSATGNMKFDEALAREGEEDAFSKEYLGLSSGDRVIVAGSTHPPEEVEIIDVYKALKAKYADLKLVLAPRHVERKDAVKIYIKRAGFTYSCFSDVVKKEAGPSGEVDVVLVDTIGHLKSLYNLATVVFIGGSIAKKGGQNPIEAARWGKPVIFGPNMQNFREIAEIFIENESAIRTQVIEHLKDTLDKLLGDEDLQSQISGNAHGVVEKNSGALSATLDVIEKYIKGKA